MKKLVEIGREDLDNKLAHTPVTDGDDADYDNQSFKADEMLLYSRVKITKDGLNSEFFISLNEIAFSEEHINQSQLIRVYKYK